MKKILIPWVLYWDCIAPIITTIKKPSQPCFSLYQANAIYVSDPNYQMKCTKSLGSLPSSLVPFACRGWGSGEDSRSKMYLMHSATHLNLSLNSFWSHYTDLKRLFMYWCYISHESNVKDFLWLKKKSLQRIFIRSLFYEKKPWNILKSLLHFKEQLDNVWPDLQGCLTLMPQMYYKLH